MRVTDDFTTKPNGYQPYVSPEPYVPWGVNVYYGTFSVQPIPDIGGVKALEFAPTVFNGEFARLRRETFADVQDDTLEIEYVRGGNCRVGIIARFVSSTQYVYASHDTYLGLIRLEKAHPVFGNESFTAVINAPAAQQGVIRRLRLQLAGLSATVTILDDANTVLQTMNATFAGAWSGEPGLLFTGDTGTYVGLTKFSFDDGAPEPDFTVAIDPSSVTLARNGPSVDVNLSLVRNATATGPVTVTLEPPVGVSGVSAPSVTIPGNASSGTISLSAGSGAPALSAVSFTVRAAMGALERTAPLLVTVVVRSGMASRNRGRKVLGRTARGLGQTNARKGSSGSGAGVPMQPFSNLDFSLDENSAWVVSL